MQPDVAPKKKMKPGTILRVFLGIIGLIVVLAIAVVGIVFLARALNGSAVRYKGKTAEEWKIGLSAKSDADIKKTEQELIMGGDKAVPVLLLLLEDDDGYYRACAAECLGTIGPDASSSVPALLKALGDRSASVRARASIALGLIGADVKESIPALQNALNDDDDEVRKAAAKALRTIDPNNRVLEIP